MTNEPPDSQCEIKRIHSVAFGADIGTVTFTLEHKRALEGNPYDTPAESPAHIMWGSGLYASGPPTFMRYAVRVESLNGDTAEVRLTNDQLRAMMRSVNAAFLK